MSENYIEKAHTNNQMLIINSALSKLNGELSLYKH